jgi:hypothetical protein
MARLDQQIPKDKLIDYGLGYWDITDPEHPNYIPSYITDPNTSTIALALPPELPLVSQEFFAVITSYISPPERDIMVSLPKINVTMEQANMLLASTPQAPSPQPPLGIGQ